jgi:AcrR family transcriptional regulator
VKRVTSKRPGIYASGAQAVDTILNSAFRVLVEEGATAFTMRRIATVSEMNVGAVSYHFPKKEFLIKVLLEDLTKKYLMQLEKRVHLTKMTEQKKLEALIKSVHREYRKKDTTRLFTELWALANHNPLIANFVRDIYVVLHKQIEKCVSMVNPSLSEEEVGTLSVFIANAIEGNMPFVGYGKPWEHKFPEIVALSANWLTYIVQETRPGEIDQLVRNAQESL